MWWPQSPYKVRTPVLPYGAAGGGEELSAKLSQYTEGDFCGQCRAEHEGWYRTSSNDRWMDKVTEAIETVFTQRPTPQRPYKATLRDLFDLNSRNGSWKKYSDRRAALMCLDATTLTKLRDRIEENRDRAVQRYGYDKWHELRTLVGLEAFLSQLPPDM
jgi:hypothetical protein